MRHAELEAFATECVASLATLSPELGAFDAWWVTRAERINRLSVDAPKLWHQVGYAIEALHYRRRRAADDRANAAH